MSLRLPRHQPQRKQAEPLSQVQIPEEQPQSLIQEPLFSDEEIFEDGSEKSDHRFVPPMPPEPPPRDVTVGGISLNPPIDHSEPPSKSQTPAEPAEIGREDKSRRDENK
jgi:hypothetical protein